MCYLSQLLTFEVIRLGSWFSKFNLNSVTELHWPKGSMNRTGDYSSPSVTLRFSALFWFSFFYFSLECVGRPCHSTQEHIFHRHCFATTRSRSRLRPSALFIQGRNTTHIFRKVIEFLSVKLRKFIEKIENLT